MVEDESGKSTKSATKKATRKSTKKATKKRAAKVSTPGGAGKRKKSVRRETAYAEGEPGEGSFLGVRLNELVEGLTGELASTARRWASDVGAAQLRLGKALLLRQPADPNLARKAGQYLRELRQVAGLTRAELSEAVELADVSLLNAVESGTATLSFDLILRLAAVLARYDPVPFVARLTRTYNPEVSRFLESWGVDRLQLQYERERRFINIYRRHDAARNLSDEGFAQVLDFTRAAFEMALHFVAEQERQEDHEVDVE